MAEETTTVRTDDLERVHGRRVEGAATVTFEYDGQRFEIDLTPENKAAWDEIMAPYLEAARRARTSGRPKRSANPMPGTGRKARRASRETPIAIREWARRNNIVLSDRGRIPDAVKDRFYAALAESAATAEDSLLDSVFAR